MGEAADDMLNGNCCESCGVWLMTEAGEINEADFPCLCVDCWNDLPPKEKKVRSYFDCNTGLLAGADLQASFGKRKRKRK